MTAVSRSPVSPSPAVFRQVDLPPAEWWRCACRDRGFGTVVARTELMGMPTGYAVELDSGELHRALPSQVRAIRDIEIPCATVRA